MVTITVFFRHGTHYTRTFHSLKITLPDDLIEIIREAGHDTGAYDATGIEISDDKHGYTIKKEL